MSRHLISRLFSLGIGTLLLLGLGWRLFNLYGSDKVEVAAYREPTRRFLRAAEALDSSALALQTDSQEVIGWAMATARQDPSLLRRLQTAVPRSADRVAGETLVWYDVPGTRNCSHAPLVIGFAGSDSAPRVQHVTVECVGGR